MHIFDSDSLLRFRGGPCAVITVLSAPFPGRSHARRQRLSRLWTNVLPRNVPTLTSLGSNLGGMVLPWRLSSVQLGWWGCRMNPQSGRPITVAPSPLNGRKKDWVNARDVFIIAASIARWRELEMTYGVSRRAKPFGSNHSYLRQRGGYLAVYVSSSI